MNKLDRRSFLKSSLLTTASFGLFPALGAETGTKKKAPAIVPSHATGANSDIRFAVVGFGGRGQDHIKELRMVDGARMVALCDVDRNILGREMKKYKDAGEQITAYTDVRKLLENKNIDVVSFATPNHWHALGAIWAMQAGKDVYVEKPVSHNVWEGRRVVEVARQLNRIVQAGTQSRSSSGITEGIAVGARGTHRQDHPRARALLQAASQHRQSGWSAADSCRALITICGADRRPRGR